MGVNQDQFNAAGSKFVTMTPEEDAKGEAYRLVEFQMPYWKSPGRTIGFPVKVTSGDDTGKDQEIFAGVDEKGVWKTKDILRAIRVPITQNKAGFVEFDDTAVFGKTARGRWIMESGHKGGDPNAEIVRYPKLVDILPAAATVEDSLV